jgi:hypothetical protein
MSYVPLNKQSFKDSLKIASRFPNAEIDPVTEETDTGLYLDKFCGGISDTITDNIYPNTQDRLNNLETAFDALLTALTTMAAAMNAIPTPVNGTAVGAALATAVTAASVNRGQRATDKAAQVVLNTTKIPYMDGYK